jgi:[ribosomal protein S5]-alanine N-acetyltransferase
MNAFHFLTPQPQDLLSLIIEGQRLRLVAISDKFELDIFKEFTSEITRYMFPSPAKDIDETRNFIDESSRSMQIGNNLQFAILSKTIGEFLGCCGLHGEDNVRTPELGIWLKKNAHGSGYGREAVRTLVDWSCNNIDIDYFIYPVDRKNIASSKIPESLGGEVVQELKTETPTGKILDKVVYKINRVSNII